MTEPRPFLQQFTNGAFSASEVPDPLAKHPDGGNIDHILRDGGWTEFLSIGGDTSTLRLQTWQRTNPPGYLVDVWDVNMGSPFVYTPTFGDLMDLLARWAPAIQAATVTWVLDELQRTDVSDDGLVEAIGARLKYGRDEVLVQMLERRTVAHNRRFARRRPAGLA